jgi:DNA-binding Lrp family transcriptional regulator
MAKSSITQIKQDEKKIVEELLRNANRNINDIAKSCGFSRQKVWRVIKNLEKNKTIWGYVTVINQEKLGKKQYILIMKRSNKPFSKELINNIINRDLTKKLKNIDIELINSYYTNGSYDWVLCFNANNIIEAKSLVEELNKIYEEYVSEVYLLENMFSVICSGVKNPEIEKLDDFFKL